MSQTASRCLFAIELVLLGLPTLIFVLPATIPGALILTPGGPRLVEDVWTGLGVLGMALLNVCSVVAIIHLLHLGIVFMIWGRRGLKGKAGTLRRGMFWAMPPFLLESHESLLRASSTNGR